MQVPGKEIKEAWGCEDVLLLDPPVKFRPSTDNMNEYIELGENHGSR